MNTNTKNFVKNIRRKKLMEEVKNFTAADLLNVRFSLEIYPMSKLYKRGKSEIMSFAIADMIERNPELRKIFEDALILAEK